MNYNIEKKDGKIYITVTLNDPGSHQHPKPRRRVKKRDILEILASQKILHEGCLEDPGILSNFEGPAPRMLTKTWIFKLAKAKSRKKAPAKKKAPKKLIKTLDID